MNSKEYIEEAEQLLLHTYNRYQIVLDRGEGMYLYDLDGKKYLDLCAGIAVFALGYRNEAFNSAVKAQVDKLVHTSNYYYNVPAVNAAEKLLKAARMDRVFFTNSGTEAIEGAIKTARKYAFKKDGGTDHEIIAMNHSFHGRSLGALSVTGNVKYQEPFKPLIGGIKFADFNDLDSVKALVTDKTCAIILEPVQGEGGVQPLDADFVHKASELCREKDILLIFDEVQTGVGRTGKLYAWEHFGVRPDILTSAKGLGGGLPVGACLCVERLGAVMGPGTHGSTFGGNPIVCAGVGEVLSRMEEPLFQQVRQRGAFLRDTLSKCDEIVEIRGMGLMLGLVLQTKQAKAVAARCVERGLLVLTAKTLVRLLPPLTISQEELEQGIAILKEVLTEK